MSWRARRALVVLVVLAAFVPVMPAMVSATEMAYRPAVIAAGTNHTCALANDGSVWCWGTDSHGQLGDGTPGLQPRLAALPVLGISRAIAVSAGDSHTCALLANGQVECWGRNQNHQLGDGSNRNLSATPVTVVGVDSAVALTSGLDHTCALLADATVACWGDDLGGGLLPEPAIPAGAVVVPSLTNVLAISAGFQHDCAVINDGSIRCWGVNTFGQLGDGTTSASSTPVTVAGLGAAVDVAAGTAFTCAALADGSAWCWGRNRDRQLARQFIASSLVPLQVGGVQDAVAIGAAAPVCALIDDGTLRCWGQGNSGEMGEGEYHDNYIPSTPIGVDDAVDLDIGGQHVCAATAAGTAMCWGSVGDGAVGVQSPGNILSPQTAAGFDAGAIALRNDSLDSAHWITGLPFDDEVDLTQATAALDEPQPSCATDALERSAWYRYTTPYDRSLRLTATGTDGSAAALVDTQAGLTEVGCATETADTTFAALAGETYYLQLGGPATSDSGTLALAAAADAANDDFANALAIDALPYADTRDTTTSHLEPEEPLPSCAPGTPPYNSTWYRFEAAADTGVQIQATGHPTRIGIYTGATLGNLDEVACLGGMTEDSRVTFSEGTTYFVQVVGVGGSGHLSLTVEEAPPLDEASPIIDTPPVPAPGSGTTLQTSMTTISWTAHDDGSGLAGFELQRKNNTGAWKTVATPADPTATVLEKLNTTHAFRVRAFDNEGNVSDWTTGPSYLPQLKQESWAKLLYRGGWSREVRSEASGGSLRSTSNLNAYVSFGFTGRGLQWVTTRGPGLGTAQITIDGVPTLVDLSSASSMSKWVAFAASWPEAAVHTVEIRNTNGLRIDLDALIVFK